MKNRNKLLLFTCFVFVLLCCQNKSVENDFIITQVDVKLLDSLKNVGFVVLEEENIKPNGIKNTKLLGYTNRKNGIYHNRELRLKV